MISTSFYFLTNYVIGQRQQVSKTSNVVGLRFTLNSAADYVIYGVRQKFCFTNDNLLLNQVGSACNLANTGSVERLIMSVEQENFIRQLVADGKNVGPLEPNAISQNKIRLKSIERYLDISKATAAHPLFPVLQSLRSFRDVNGQALQVKALRVVLTRNESIHLPKSGREVYINARVELVSGLSAKEALRIGNKELAVNSQIVIYPREVGSFALLVPQDLYMDREWKATMGAGDVSLHKFTSRKELGTNTGLVFQSPVFVNRNIVLPKDTAGADATPDDINYSAVTFADRVYLGNGDIMTANGRYVPRTMGQMGDRFWADVRTFGGFLRGIENDGGLDAGLVSFADKTKSIAVDKTLMAKCQDLGNSIANKDNLFKSELSARLRDEDINEAEYRIYLSNWNQFSPQGNALQMNKAKWGNGKATLSSSYYNDAVVAVQFVLGDRMVEAQMPKRGTLKLEPEVGSAALEKSLKDKVTSSQSNYDAAKAALDSMNKNLSDLRSDLKSKEILLAAEMDKPLEPEKPKEPEREVASDGREVKEGGEVPETPKEPVVDDTDYRDLALVSSLNSQITSLKKAISDAQAGISSQDSTVNLASKQLDSDKTNLNTYLLQKANPPVFEISTSPVKSGMWWEQPDKLTIDVKASNVKNLLDKDGNYSDPIIAIQAYDSTYYKSKPVGDVNPKLLRYLNLKFQNNYKEIRFPGNMSADPAGSSAITLAEGGDMAELEQQCQEARGTMTSASFGGAGWDVSFAATARTSWNFAGDSSSTIKADPALNTLEIVDTRETATFQVRSIVGKCIIRKAANFVTGFFTCDELEIESRGTPLRIIGTFIVGKMKIHPDAIKAGINWSSIYHPQATRELRAAGNPRILRSFSGASCNAPDEEPIWHPIPSIKTVSDRMACNAISLRGKADPFQWTAVDPDCGIAPGATASNTTCKRRLVRFFVVEQSREGGI